MENRFGVKDFVNVLLLVAILVTMWLKMLQDDRQWTNFARMQEAISQQTQDLAALRRAINSGGISAATPADGAAAATGDTDTVFKRLRQAQKLPDYARGDWLVESFGSAIPTLNPLMSQDIYSHVVAERVVEALGTTDFDTLETVPLLAKTWQADPNGLWLKVQLREGVSFSDGQPFTADDVVFSYDVMMDPAITDGREREYYEIITKVEKLSPHEVMFHFKKPFFESVDRALGISMLPKHLFAKYTPQQIREHTALLMGTGPYRLKNAEEYTPGGGQIELVRNERYWGEPGPWDRIVWRIVEKESSEMITFRNRGIDIFQPMPDQHFEMLKDEQLVKQTQHFVYDSVRFGYSYIAWNEQRKGQPTRFADKRVRRAMTMMIDRERLLNEVFQGLGSLTSTLFHHLGPQHAPDVSPLPYDPEAGIKLLEEAGYKRNAAGVMIGPDGQPFEFSLTYPAGSDFTQKVMLFIRDNLARGGVNMKLDPQKWALMIKSLDEKNFDAISLSWSSNLETDPKQAFHTSSIKEGDNRNAYSNPKLDELIDKAEVTLDKAERMKLWQECDRIISEDQPYTFLIRAKARIWFDSRIKNVERVPVIGLNYVNIWPNPYEWYVPKALQLRGK